MRTIGIYLFDEIEVLDFAGPFEVFSTAVRVFLRMHPGSEAPFKVLTISASGSKVTARGGLVIEPQFSIDQHPKIDVLLVPGGVVTAELEKPAVIAWIATQAAQTELSASICTGAFLIGKAGLLKGRRATTHWSDIADLRAYLPDTEIITGQRWVDEGTVITSAGISAGLDMSLHLIARLAGKDLAIRTARQMEYDWLSDH